MNEEWEAYGISLDVLYLFNNGSLHHSYRTLGAHPMRHGNVDGTRFALWAPNAAAVRLVGQFNQWDGRGHELAPIASTGVWWIFVPGLGEGELYKFELIGSDGSHRLKADPYAFRAELRPGTASVVSGLGSYKWRDSKWQQRKAAANVYESPMLVYEVHFGSWKIKGIEHYYTYEELAGELVDYAAANGYTHIELMPLAEHPFDRSWGYQITGYFAPTSRYGTPQQLKRFVERAHQHGLGVILDWVPGHFCKDDHGLRLFDGTPLYEGADPRRAEKPLWGTLAFDYGRAEVESFLISNAIYWLDVFHFDGLRVDAVASMIDLHFDKPPELLSWNAFGGTDNLEALGFLKRLNEAVFRYYPDSLMIAEDSSSRPAVTSPTYMGGLGFNFKWNMGWMNDLLRYMALPASERPQHHNLITFSIMYAYNENYVLPLSHDEVVHGKHSLLNKMPGSYEQRFAQLRLFYGYWMCHPGKKLLFMGGEWAHYDEWKDLEMLDWMLLDYELHSKMHAFVRKLNRLYKQLPPLWEQDYDSHGFEWLDVHDASRSMIAFMRRGKSGTDFVAAICHFSDQAYDGYRLGVPAAGKYKRLLASSDPQYGGDGKMPASYKAVSIPCHGKPYSLELNLPPYSFLLLHWQPASLTLATNA